MDSGLYGTRREPRSDLPDETRPEASTDTSRATRREPSPREAGGSRWDGEPGEESGAGGTRREPDGPGGGTRREAAAYGTRREAGAPTDGAGGFVSVHVPASLLERFEVLRELPTEGAEATVLVVTERASGEERVLKLYRPKVGLRSDAVDKMLAISRDPEGRRHVVVTYEIAFDDESGLWFEVQEYCPHGSLSKVLKEAHRNGARPPVEAVDLADQLVPALAYLQSRRLYHRDLKPANLLVRSFNPLDVVAADIGLARDADTGGSVIWSQGGTIAYQPPEAAFNRVTPAWDWWSVGIILLELILGRHPLTSPDGQGPIPAQVLDRINRQPLDLSAIDHQRLRLLCQGLLHRNPEHRWTAQQATVWHNGDTAHLEPDTGPAATAPTGDSAADTSKPTIRFAGDIFTEPEGVAAALQERWDYSIEQLYQQRDKAWIRQLRTFLEHHKLDDAARMVSARPSNAADLPTNLAKLLIAIDPDLTPRYAGTLLTPDGLQNAAIAALNGQGAPTKLHQIRTSGVLTEWASLPGMDTFPPLGTSHRQQRNGPNRTSADVQNAWDANCKDLDELTATTRSRGGTPSDQALDKARVQLLLCAINPSHHRKLNRKLNAKFSLRGTRTERQAPWWNALAIQAPHSPAAAALATLLRPDARHTAETTKPGKAPAPEPPKPRRTRGTLTPQATGRTLNLRFTAVWTGLLIGSLQLVRHFEDELRWFLAGRGNDTGTARPHILNIDDLDLVLEHRGWVIGLAWAFVITQVVGTWLRNEPLPAMVARSYVLVASAVQLATALAVATGAAFAVLLAYIEETSLEFLRISEHVPNWAGWGWLGIAVLVAAVPVAWGALRRFLTALGGGQVTTR